MSLHQALEERKRNGSSFLIDNIGRVHRRGHFSRTNSFDFSAAYELLPTFWLCGFCGATFQQIQQQSSGRRSLAGTQPTIGIEAPLWTKVQKF